MDNSKDPTVYTVSGDVSNGDHVIHTSKENEAGTDHADGDDEKKFVYDVYEPPNVIISLVFALQQVLLSLSASLSTALLVADVICAKDDEVTKAKLLSTTLFISGICTLLQNLIGIRIPLYQGPAVSYVVPLTYLMELESWKCPSFNIIDANGTSTFDTTAMHSEITTRAEKVAGSLMIGGAIHFLVGALGLVGLVIRWIGPITVIPTLTVTTIVVYKSIAKFAGAQMGIAFFTVAVAVVLSLYLERMNTPIPAWSKKRGCHIKWLPVHTMLSVLIAIMAGWGLSAIFTAAGGFSEERNSTDYYARTDTRLYVIDETDWFRWPYPGQFGGLSYDTGSFITFLLGTVSSIIDSIGDYYACVKVIDAPPPPKHAVNRGIMVEGLMSFFGGWTGAGHATSTFGGNIGAIGITKVASLRVFQFVGVIFIVFGVIGKLGAVFVTIPYSVVGGTMIINFGVLIGVLLGNMQFIDMNSTRNLAIIGISMLTALMLPQWVVSNADVIATGSARGDETIKMFLGNPTFLAGVCACFMDNTVPGTLEERGMVHWRAEVGVSEEELAAQAQKIARKSVYEQERLRQLNKCIYMVPFADKLLKLCPWLRYLPFYPKHEYKTT